MKKKIQVSENSIGLGMQFLWIMRLKNRLNKPINFRGSGPSVAPGHQPNYARFAHAPPPPPTFTILNSAFFFY